MAPFPWVKVLALMAAFVSQMTADFGLSSYVGYMVASLHVVDGKDSAGETWSGVEMWSRVKMFPSKFGDLCMYSLFI